jgi:hypothetical protein
MKHLQPVAEQDCFVGVMNLCFDGVLDLQTEGAQSGVGFEPEV